MQGVSHALLLRVEVTLVVGVGSDFNRHVLYNLESVAFESHTLHGVVGQQTNLADANLSENLRTHAVVSEVGVKAQMDVGIHRVESLFLQ